MTEVTTIEMAEVLKGHKIVGRLNPDETKLLCELRNSLVPLGNILTTLRYRNSRIATTIKYIYNVLHQYLMKSLVENKYVYHYRKYVDSEDVMAIFWMHPDCIKFFNMFSNALVLYSTYKTNKHHLSLSEFIGITYDV